MESHQGEKMYLFSVHSGDQPRAIIAFSNLDSDIQDAMVAAVRIMLSSRERTLQ